MRTLPPLSPSTLIAFHEEHFPRYLHFLEQMVAINSFTANAAGVNALGALTAEVFGELGFSAIRVPSENALFGNHLVLKRLAGAGRPTVGMVSHLDTVFPPDEEAQNNFHWHVDRDRIYGPGTVDIKGGTVMMFMVLSGLKERAPAIFDGINWVLLLNAAEEELDPGFGRVCRAHLPADALGALVFEGGRVDSNRYSVVTARKGRATFHVEVHGRAAHAGSAHEYGANAILQLAETIREVGQITDYARQLTVNVGTAAGGSVTNRVPHLARASGEIRAFDPGVLDEAITRLLQVAEEAEIGSANGEFRCSVEVTVLGRSAPWPSNPATERLAAIWAEAGLEIDVTVEGEHRGGLSDGNHIWDYVPTLDGLGPAGGNAHCSERSPDGSKEQEYLQLDSLIPKAILNTKGIIKLTRSFTRA
jgi:glutamate carboxypeptidase